MTQGLWHYLKGKLGGRSRIYSKLKLTMSREVIDRRRRTAWFGYPRIGASVVNDKSSNLREIVQGIGYDLVTMNAMPESMGLGQTISMAVRKQGDCAD